MNDYRKFKKSEWDEFYKNYCKEMDIATLWELYKGLKIIKDILYEFYKNRYGGDKRYKDLREYWDVAITELLKRNTEKE